VKYVSVDVEADGPAPGLYSMVALGAVVVEPALDRTFGATLAPISDRWLQDALVVSGYTREATLAFPEPAAVMADFARWLDAVGGGERLLFVSDNAGFDWQFVNYYFHRFAGANPFGFSSLSLTSLYKGFKREMRANFRRDGLRKTRHSHDPVADAKGNAEVLLALFEQGLR
jgi:hypothetical protein